MRALAHAETVFCSAARTERRSRALPRQRTRAGPVTFSPEIRGLAATAHAEWAYSSVPLAAHLCRVRRLLRTRAVAARHLWGPKVTPVQPIVALERSRAALTETRFLVPPRLPTRAADAKRSPLNPARLALVTVEQVSSFAYPAARRSPAPPRRRTRVVVVVT
ncbi:MAG: hypothetical protein ACI81R_001104 [Bradymonadia bacterium]|jgi:hypothetical protein